MEGTISKTATGKGIKRTFWGAFAFYILIAFEFLYMASPFAVYFYSVYAPALNFLNHSPLLAWLPQYFMPHFSQTSSFIINAHNIVGAVLAVLGFLGFCTGAVQVYYHKLAKKGTVSGGIYKYIRHPQYLCFAVCSFGLLILWPRYIVLVIFTVMLFVYYLLAKAEEKECEAKFGQSYMEYKNRTGMFIPFVIQRNKSKVQKSKPKRILKILMIYILTLGAALQIAFGLQRLTLNSLYITTSKDMVNLALCNIEKPKLEKIVNAALSDNEVKTRIGEVNYRDNVKKLNYVLPVEWFAAEVPMNGINMRSNSHSEPSRYDSNLFKVIFTKAEMRGSNVYGRDILLNIIRRQPLLEVWVNVSQGKVYKILNMPESIMYKDIPVAVY